jgi:hypothetical protein
MHGTLQKRYDNYADVHMEPGTYAVGGTGQIIWPGSTLTLSVRVACDGWIGMVRGSEEECGGETVGGGSPFIYVG